MSHTTTAHPTINKIRVFNMCSGPAGQLLFRQLFYFITAFDLVHKDLRRLKAGDEVLIDHECSITGNISGDLFLALLIDEAAKAANVDVVTIRH